MADVPRPVRWLVPSREEINRTPEDVKREIGYRLRRLQNGEHGSDRNIKRFGEDRRIANLVKIVAEGEDGNTYRVAVCAEFSEGLWVLDVFEKRSRQGIATPKRDIDRIADRLQRLKGFRATSEGSKMIAGMEAETEAPRRRSAAAARVPLGGRQ